MLWLVVASLLPLPSCTGTTTQVPSGGTQAGTYGLTVTATAGSDSKSQTIQLTVP